MLKSRAVLGGVRGIAMVFAPEDRVHLFCWIPITSGWFLVVCSCCQSNKDDVMVCALIEH
jgi:hypothetical protein